MHPRRRQAAGARFLNPHRDRQVPGRETTRREDIRLEEGQLLGNGSSRPGSRPGPLYAILGAEPV